MAIIGRYCTAKETRQSNRYRAAYKRWVIALYNKEILGKDKWVYVRLSEYNQDGDWVRNLVVTGKEYEDTYKNMPDDSSTHYAIQTWTSEYQVANFFMRGWKRKSGGVM